jgi:spermidine synthase
MKPWETLDTGRAPDGGELVLARRGDELVIRVDGQMLMSSRMHGSEETLARAGCVGLGAGARVLIGGLGLGDTLRAALDALPEDATVVVAEIAEAVVAWNRGVLGPLAGQPLDDPRARVVVDDVLAVIGRERDLDAILLDVDNGPRGLTRDANDALYGRQGIAACVRALAPGGVLSVWSAADDRAYAARLADAGLAVDVKRTPARERKGGRHVLFMGRWPGRGRA